MSNRRACWWNIVRVWLGTWCLVSPAEAQIGIDRTYANQPFQVAWRHDGLNTTEYRLFRDDQLVSLAPASALVNGEVALDGAGPDGLSRLGPVTFRLDSFGPAGTAPSAPFVVQVVVPAGEPFIVESEHDGLNTDTYDLRVDGVPIQWKPVSQLQNGTISFTLNEGLQAGSYVIAIAASNLWGASPSPGATLVVETGVGAPAPATMPRLILGPIPPPPPAPACSDGVDNDADGQVDMNDLGCTAPDDTDETDPPPTPAACADGLDNDGDGRIDLGDPGCSSTNDTDETDLPQCGDGVDNDGDGLADLADPGCTSQTDTDETDTPPTATWAEVAGQRATSPTQMQRDSATLAYPQAVQANSLLVVAGAAWGAAAPTSVAVTSSGAGCTGLSWSVAFNTTVPSGVTWRTFVASARTTTSGACTVTVNPSGAPNDFSWSQDEFTGPTATQTGTACVGTSSSPACSTTVPAGALVVGVMTHDGSTRSLTPGSGWTQIGEHESNADNQAHNVIFRVVPSASSVTVSWTMGGSAPWAAQVRVF